MRCLLFGVLAGATMGAWGGEIVFIDPTREKAQALERQQEDALGAKRVSPATERVREAIDYLNETPAGQPVLILRAGPPPSEAARARQAARAWIQPESSSSTASRCRTENTVGVVEGAQQGYTVIQGSTKDVSSVCK